MIKDNFKTASGHNWLFGEKVDIEEIKKFFISKKVSIKETIETGRFLNIIGNIDNQKVFIKVATSQGLKQQLLNEISWHKELERIRNINLHLPPLLENGYIEDVLVYAIYKFVQGKPLDLLIDKIDSEIIIKLAPRNGLIFRRVNQNMHYRLVSLHTLNHYH